MPPKESGLPTIPARIRPAMVHPPQPANTDVTIWLAWAQKGDNHAASVLWDGYFERLVAAARQYLKQQQKRVADEEDIALSAMNSFFVAAKAGNFPQLRDRTDLWRLLLTITSRKALAKQRRDFALKRQDARHVDACGGAAADSSALALDQLLADHEPLPDEAAAFAEEVRWQLSQLPDDELRQIVTLRLEGYTNREIADRMNTYERRIERKLIVIRQHWLEESEGPIEAIE